jgi:hypothetical protein
MKGEDYEFELRQVSEIMAQKLKKEKKELVYGTRM